MSSIHSTVKKIDDLWLEKWPDKNVYTPEKIVRCEGVTVMKLKKGYKLYCDSIKNNVSYSGVGNWPFNTGLMKCLLKLKIITKEQMNEHLENIKIYQDKQDKKYLLERFIKAGEKYDFEITGEQWARLGGLVCDSCGEVITDEDKDVGIDCHLHQECAEET